MAKKQMLTEEGMIDKIITAIFTAIGKGQSSPPTQKLMKDPKYRKLHKELEDSREDLAQYLEKLRKSQKTPTPTIDKMFPTR